MPSKQLQNLCRAIHITYENKRRRINQIYARNKRRGKVLYQKYRKRERHRVQNYLCHLIKHMIGIPATHGFEALDKQKMNRHAKKRWNRELQHTNWRMIVTLLKNKVSIREVTPYYTSKICARCGYIHQDLRGEHIFECPKCGLRIDRQLNAAINIYLKMRGVSHKITWFDRVICGGFPLIGVETSTADELARRLDELMKPQVYRCVTIST